MKHLSKLLFLLFLLTQFAIAQRELGVRPTETGGPLIFEQAAYDVQAYDIAITVNPAAKSISGTTVMTAKIVIPTNVIVLDLDTPYAVTGVFGEAQNRQARLKFERREGRVWIWFPSTKQAGETFETIITYSGIPRVAPNPPWIGGFMWKQTADGSPWISVALQNDGSDLLFPVKDHPSDKAEGVAMRITVPDPLVAAGPGKLVSVKKNAGGTSTYYWRMTNPIPNYSIVFNAAPYRRVEDSVKSITGETIPIVFYVLPESYDKGAYRTDKKIQRFLRKISRPFSVPLAETRYCRNAASWYGAFDADRLWQQI